eukprot:1194932-Prorocentrum_minimum.AAC.8
MLVERPQEALRVSHHQIHTFAHSLQQHPALRALHPHVPHLQPRTPLSTVKTHIHSNKHV